MEQTNEWNICIRFIYIPTKENTIADAISRGDWAVAKAMVTKEGFSWKVRDIGDTMSSSERELAQITSKTSAKNERDEEMTFEKG